jgi:hypothetical protein
MYLGVLAVGFQSANRVRSQTPMRFSGIPAVGALRFSKTLRIAFDDTGINEGVALRLLS